MQCVLRISEYVNRVSCVVCGAWSTGRSGLCRSTGVHGVPRKRRLRLFWIFSRKCCQATTRASSSPGACGRYTTGRRWRKPKSGDSSTSTSSRPGYCSLLRRLLRCLQVPPVERHHSRIEETMYIGNGHFVTAERKFWKSVALCFVRRIADPEIIAEDKTAFAP
ncbi:uncharacterized protein LOC112452145 [Temnothorax curvispinosus]|uniref:Uncharacterized protein LOC112452145 n=1 Tax=Temnothorax curvispinosus TaxID=300111 RepID=A0A6J1PEM3_9HYME|nr:uncharacterized protein LOC112452145 [Temnothorax curvispinosus]